MEIKVTRVQPNFSTSEADYEITRPDGSIVYASRGSLEHKLEASGVAKNEIDAAVIKIVVLDLGEEVFIQI